MEWIIYYGDGTKYSDDDGAPEVAPKRNVQAINVADKRVGRRVERSDNFYIYVPDRGTWRGVDQFGLFDYMIEPGYKIVLYGRTLSNVEYGQVLKRATKDPDMPAKSSFAKGERLP